MQRLKLITFFIFIFYAVIIIRLFYLQFLDNKRQQENYLSIQKIFPERGKIYDKEGNPLVLNQSRYLLFIDKSKIKKDSEQFLGKILSEILKIEQSSIEGKLKQDRIWIPIIANLDEENKKKIESLKIAGVGFEKSLNRYYPEASLSAHLLGFLGKNEKGENVGYFGLEGFYNKELTGLLGFIKSEKDLLGRPMMFGYQERVEAEDGQDLYLNIEKPVQEIAKKNLLAGIEKYQAEGGCIIIAQPQTMAILAMVCLPDFDPKDYYLFSEDYFKNPAITDLFEPGSIFKPLIMAAAIEENKIKPIDMYDEKGPIFIGGYKIKTWNDKYEGKITMTRILEKSSNVGMVYVGEKLGKENILKYLKKYRFDSLTGIDLQGEARGYLKSDRELYPIDYATITFGQGIAVTQIQMITAFSSLINGGKLMKPYLVYKIVGKDKIKAVKPKLMSQVLSIRTSMIMKKMLQSTVENAEVNWDIPKGYTFGGKTGTAQIPIAGKYDPTKTYASFIGFFPVDNPLFIILVTLKEPTTSSWGSETSAPIFFKIAKDLIGYYGIMPK